MGTVLRPLRSRLSAVAVIALVAAACSGDDSNGDADSAPNDSPIATESPPGEGDSASADAEQDTANDPGGEPHAGFGDAITVHDEPFDVATVTGTDTVAWFWAPWCTICRAEGPEVAEFAEQYADDITFVGVAGRGELDAMVDFIDDTGTGGFTHVADLDGSIWTEYGVFSQPAFAFINDDGESEVFGGAMGGDALAEKLDELIAS